MGFVRTGPVNVPTKFEVRCLIWIFDWGLQMSNLGKGVVYGGSGVVLLERALVSSYIDPPQ